MPEITRERMEAAYQEYGDIVSKLLVEITSTSKYYFNKAALAERILFELYEESQEESKE